MFVGIRAPSVALLPVAADYLFFYSRRPSLSAGLRFIIVAVPAVVWNVYIFPEY